MKFLIALLILVYGLNGYSQSMEKNICQCVETNFRSVGLESVELYKELENSLIEDGIITKQFQSRINKIEEYVNSGMVSEIRSYEHIDFESINLKVLRFCISLNNYNQEWSSVDPTYIMFQRIEQIGIETYQTRDYGKLLDQSARIILDYVKDENKNSDLWNMITLSALYHLTDTKLEREINTSLEWRDTKPIDTLNSINVEVSRDNEILIERQLVKIEDICNQIRSSILEGKSIHLQCHRETSYKIYLEVYNGMKDCYFELRDQMSREQFGEDFDKLNDVDQKVMMERYPIKIYESEPKG